MIQRILFILFFCAVSITFLTGQVVITGNIIDLDGNPLEGITVDAGASDLTSSDEMGKFYLDVPSIANLEIRFSGNQFDEVIEVVGRLKGDTLTMGNVTLTSQSNQIEDFIPTISLSDDNDIGTGDNISGLLTASRDIFNSTAAFVFGPARFRIRGYDSENTLMFLNNVPMNDLEVGRVFWSTWGGLNDVLRNNETQTGMGPIDFTLGGVGGGTAIDLRASSQRAQKRITYSLTNRAYRNRLMATYSTGLTQKNWALTISASRRWAQEGWIDGTFYDAYAYFISVDRKFSDQHSLNLVVFGAPNKRGRNGATTQEMYDLAGTNYYNPYWGYQAGEKRNSRIANNHSPVSMLRHDWNISDETILTTSVSFQKGRVGSSALDWYNANDPRPDYYRKLPSWVTDPGLASRVAKKLMTDETSRQIDWDLFYDVNRNDMTTIEDVDGIDGNDISGHLSRYIVEERRYDPTNANISMLLQHQLSNNAMLRAGAYGRYQKNENYKLVKDLLGGDFYVDFDKFAERDLAGNDDAIQNDLNNPNRILEEGDRFFYDYDANIRNYGGWVQTQVFTGKVDFIVGAGISQRQFWRTGNFKNGKFPDSSFGDSEKYNFTNYSLKAGLTYKIDGRNYLYVNGIYMTRAPFFRNSFVSPRTRNQAVNGLQSETIRSVEAGYTIRAPYLKGRISGYYTDFLDQTLTRSFYHDDERSFVNFSMTGIDKQHIGIEAALEATIAPGIRVHGVASVGQYIFNSRPIATVTQDNSAEVLAENVTVYAKNFYVSGTPQSAYTAGLSYQSKNYWSLYLNVNYFDDVWIDFNPLRRTTFAVDLVDPETTLWRSIIDQEKGPSAWTMNASFYKSFLIDWFKDRMYFSINLSVSNALDNQEFITGGYEQLRFDFEGKDVDRFPPKYYYFQGLNYFINLSLRF